MAPCLPTDDAGDIDLTNPKLLSQVTLSDVADCIPTSDLLSNLKGELGATWRSADGGWRFGTATFRPHVGEILGIRAKEPVCGVLASPDITSVANEEVSSDLSESEFPADSVCLGHPPSAITSHLEDAVPLVGCGRPEHASIAVGGRHLVDVALPLCALWPPLLDSRSRLFAVPAHHDGHVSTLFMCGVERPTTPEPSP